MGRGKVYLNSSGRGLPERELICLDHVIHLQDGKSLVQRAPQDKSSLESFIALRLILSMAGRCWVRFLRGNAKQEGSKWLKIFWFELFLKQMDL